MLYVRLANNKKNTTKKIEIMLRKNWINLTLPFTSSIIQGSHKGETIMFGLAFIPSSMASDYQGLQ